MDRVVVLGRGGAGKSVLARGIAERTGAPDAELVVLRTPRTVTAWLAALPS